jgi:hypothetical protein
MAVIVTTLTNNNPKYFTSQTVAFEQHYEEGGYLWKRKNSASMVYKPFASGILPLARLEIYELYMVNGRKPTNEDIQDAQKACAEAMDLDCAIM